MKRRSLWGRSASIGTSECSQKEDRPPPFEGRNMTARAYCTEKGGGRSSFCEHSEVPIEADRPQRLRRFIYPRGAGALTGHLPQRGLRLVQARSQSSSGSSRDFLRPCSLSST